MSFLDPIKVSASLRSSRLEVPERDPGTLNRVLGTEAGKKKDKASAPDTYRRCIAARKRARKIEAPLSRHRRALF